MDTGGDGALSGLNNADELHTEKLVRPTRTFPPPSRPTLVPAAAVLTFPQAPSPITTIFSCLSWLSSSESDMTLTRAERRLWPCSDRTAAIKSRRRRRIAFLQFITEGIKDSGETGDRAPFSLLEPCYSVFGTAHSHVLCDTQPNFSFV